MCESHLSSDRLCKCQWTLVFCPLYQPGLHTHEEELELCHSNSAEKRLKSSRKITENPALPLPWSLTYPKFGPQISLRMPVVVPNPLVVDCCAIVPPRAHYPCGWVLDHGRPWDPADLYFWHCSGRSADCVVEQRPLFICIIDTIWLLHNFFHISCISCFPSWLHIGYHWRT